jgi:hypothetical protein
VDVRDETADVRLIEDRKACLACVLAFMLSLGFQRTHQATGGGGRRLTRPSPAVRGRLGGVPSWRLQCPRCRAVCPVLPHVVWRDRQMRPDVASNAVFATPGGSVGRCAP